MLQVGATGKDDEAEKEEEEKENYNYWQFGFHKMLGNS
jgi:hypothetical protein